MTQSCPLAPWRKVLCRNPFSCSRFIPPALQTFALISPQCTGQACNLYAFVHGPWDCRDNALYQKSALRDLPINDNNLDEKKFRRPHNYGFAWFVSNSCYCEYLEWGKSHYLERKKKGENPSNLPSTPATHLSLMELPCCLLRKIPAVWLAGKWK